ncbi:MAG: beta-lactamase family protein, partial [Dehalococcoidia bacterium]|nr:beta-lactamase family protein [Dehalococcoidia bacterium]
AVMQLVEEGRVDLDAPVQRYLPWFRVAADADSAVITPRRLLAHTSGLSTAVGNQRLVPGDPRDATIERYARALATVPLTAPPGQRYQYSNANYVVLGALIEAVSGLSYEAYLQRHIFGPLQMTDSFAFTPGVTARPIANGVRLVDGLPSPLLPGLAPYWQPAGTIGASAEDLGRYLIMLLNGGRFRDARLLSPEGVAALWRPTATVSPSTSYALGWSIAQQNGATVLWHNGLLTGRRSYMAVLPDHQLGVALLLTVNESSPPPPTDVISRELRARLLAVPR